MSQLNLARYESAIARAFKAVWQARQQALELGWDDGEGMTLWGVLGTLTELQRLAAGGRRGSRRRRRSQLALEVGTTRCEACGAEIRSGVTALR